MTGWPGPLWRPVAAAAGAATAVAIVGATLTDIGPWYQMLRVPPWKPPDWLFGPAWTTIFACATASAVLAWRTTPEQRARRGLIGLYLTNGLLNVVWSALFFNLKRPDWALIETAPFIVSIVAIMVVTWRRSRAASLLMAPYLAWVAFATVLNWEIVRLNAPFS
ncbi:MAG: tryptophan-rich sensory protein [Alphaproteobacteria bacterium]|nr:tryptophan-rich sensory protein [Alphaproteobacteria bacterium]